MMRTPLGPGRKSPEMTSGFTYLTCWTEEGCTRQILKPSDVTHESDSAHKCTCAIASQNGFTGQMNCNGRSRACSINREAWTCPAKIVAIKEITNQRLRHEKSSRPTQEERLGKWGKVGQRVGLATDLIFPAMKLFRFPVAVNALAA